MIDIKKLKDNDKISDGDSFGVIHSITKKYVMVWWNDAGTPPYYYPRKVFDAFVIEYGFEVI